MSLLKGLEQLKELFVLQDKTGVIQQDLLREAYFLICGEKLTSPNYDVHELEKVKKKVGRPKKSKVITRKVVQSLIDTQNEIKELEEKKAFLSTAKKESRSEPVRFKGNAFVDDGTLHSDERGSITGIAKVDKKLKTTWTREKPRPQYKARQVNCSVKSCGNKVDIPPDLYDSEQDYKCDSCILKRKS